MAHRTPFVPQDAPLEMLGRSLSRAFSGLGRPTPWREVAAELTSPQGGLVRLARDLLDLSDEEHRALVLFVDQGEELVTLCNRRARVEFASLLSGGPVNLPVAPRCSLRSCEAGKSSLLRRLNNPQTMVAVLVYAYAIGPRSARLEQVGGSLVGKRVDWLAQEPKPFCGISSAGHHLEPSAGLGSATRPVDDTRRRCAPEPCRRDSSTRYAHHRR